MAEAIGKIPKPNLRGFVHAQVKRSLIGSLIACTATVIIMRITFNEPEKKKWADFYKNYDIEKEFDEMRNKGLFQSAPRD